MNADVHALAGAYVLDALPESEAAAFTEHLQRCPACQQEVAELQVTAAQLGIAATAQPPNGLREQVLRSVRQTRQVPPATPAARVGERRRARPRLLAAAAAVALVLGAGVLGIRPLLDHGVEPSPQNRIVTVMHASDARSSTTPLHGGGSLTVVSSGRLHQAVVLGERLPRLDRAHDYQLWLVDRIGDARSAHVLIDGSGGPSQGPRLVTGLRAGDQIAITREPAGGSRQPTTAPLATTSTT
jgi:anti-sigma-K factor RskA